MSEETESEEAGGRSDDGSAKWAALGAASREKADRFLDEQTSFVQLQKEHLHEQRLLLLSHLKWRRFDDQMKGALQIMLVALGGLIVIAVLAAVWDASQADGLVIDEFSVPPAFEQAGISGEVLTEDFTGKLSDIRDFANENSYSRSKEVTAGRKNEVRIEIPEVGISIAEAQHFLRDWLGHERHVSGNLRNAGNGKITLTVNVSGSSPVSVTGSDLKSVEEEAAEKTFGVLDPVNIVNYLAARHRIAEAMAAAANYVPIAQTAAQKSDSYALWGYTTADATGDVPLAIARIRVGISLDPALAAPRIQLAKFLYISGQEEEVLTENRLVLTLKDADQLPAHRGGGFDLMRSQAAAGISELLGDYANTSVWCGHFCSYTETLLSRAENAARQHDAAGSWRLMAEALASGDVDASAISEVRYHAHAARGEWREAAADMTAAIGDYFGLHTGVSARYARVYTTARFVPLLAIAEARSDRLSTAHRAIDATPVNCYICLRARGVIAETEGRPGAATYWYARAVQAAPSIPFAYTDWGAMLMSAARYDAAIEKFGEANTKGPHFADPLEMWGEALMAKNRADLARDKFEEADRYAPNWGRLHLKWGEALFYAGEKDESKKQIAIATGLDLPSADKSELESWMKSHG
jgi:tetratricopeptide (TPR) repeat protein